MIERPVTVDGFGRLYIRPLQYGDTIRFYGNRERSPRMLAALFRASIGGGGFDDCTPADVRRMPAGIAGVLEYAIVAASGLLQSDREDAADSDDGEEDDYEPPEHSVMTPEPGDAGDQAADALDEFDESDLINFLTEKGYTFGEIYQLLPAEIDQLTEGHTRASKREERRRKEQQDSTTDPDPAYAPDAEEPPAYAPGYR